MTRKTRDMSYNFIDHSYANQAPNELSHLENLSSRTTSVSSYVNSDHSYHVPANRITKRKASSTGEIFSKKLRKPIHVSSQKESIEATATVASTAEQVTSSTLVASPSSQEVIPLFEDQNAGTDLANLENSRPEAPPNIVAVNTDVGETEMATNLAQLSSLLSADQAQSYRNHADQSFGQMLNAIDDAFGQFVVSSLRCMSTHRRNMTRLQIMQVINDCMLAADCD